jgi:hypothetical protein
MLYYFKPDEELRFENHWVSKENKKFNRVLFYCYFVSQLITHSPHYTYNAITQYSGTT